MTATDPDLFALLSSRNLQRAFNQSLSVIKEHTVRPLPYAIVIMILLALGRRGDAMGVLSSAIKATNLAELAHAATKVAPLVGSDSQHLFQLLDRIRAQLPTTGAPLPLDNAAAAGQRYINVLGTSHARSFGAHPMFLPIFAGIGRTMLTLTDAAFAGTRQRLTDNHVRLDSTQDLILVLGGEPRLHYENHLGTRTSPSGELTDADFRMMEKTAERYADIVDELRHRQTGRLILYNVLPTYDFQVNLLTAHLNRRLARICADREVAFLDIQDQILDPASGGIRRELTAFAYAGDFHLGFQAMPLILDCLKNLGVLSLEECTLPVIEWRYVHTFSFCPLEPSRIWCEPAVSPNNAITSEKIAATHTAGRALPAICSVLAAMDRPVLVTVNIADGWLSLNIPPQLVDIHLAISRTPQEAAIASRVARLMGRTDVAFENGETRMLADLAGKRAVCALITEFPDSFKTDRAYGTAVTAIARPQQLMVLTTEAALAPYVNLGYMVEENHMLGNQKLAGPWKEARLVQFARSTAP